MPSKKITNNVVKSTTEKTNYEKVYEQANADLSFLFVGTGAFVNFDAYLTAISDTFLSGWKKTPVYGRMDNIANFEGTTRSINLAWDIPAASLEQAIKNLSNVSQLVTFLYPIIDEGPDGVGNINTPPILRLKFGNLVKDISGQGLLGYIDGAVAITPDLEYGMFIQDGMFYPKNIKLSISYTILHTHKLGFYKGINKKFPYGVDNSAEQKDWVEDYGTQQSVGGNITRTEEDNENVKLDESIPQMSFIEPGSVDDVMTQSRLLSLLE